MSFASVLRPDVFVAPRGGYRCVGVNPAVGATAEAVWGAGGVYNFTMPGTTIKIASDNAADDAAGTGARTVAVYGIVDGVAVYEVATMDGVTPVNLTSAFDRVYLARVITAGTAEGNVGNVYVFTGTATAGVPDSATAVYLKMLPATGQTADAIFQVPSGVRGNVVSMWAHCGDADNPVRVEFFVRSAGVRRSIGSGLVVGGVWQESPIVPEGLLAGDDVYAQATCLGVGTPEVTACFEIVLR